LVDQANKLKSKAKPNKDLVTANNEVHQKAGSESKEKQRSNKVSKEIQSEVQVGTKSEQRRAKRTVSKGPPFSCLDLRNIL
jgi:hypothetical protein